MVNIKPASEQSREEIEESLSLVQPGKANEVVIPKNECIEVDFDALARILIEHHIYEESDKSNKIDILHTIRNSSDDWIEIDEITNEHDLNKSTVYRNIKELRKKDLVEKIGSDRSGLYVYQGP